MTKVREIKTGKILERQSVDARELVEHDAGEYEYVETEAEDRPRTAKQRKAAANAVRDKREQALEEMSAEEVRVLALAAGVAAKTKGENIENLLNVEFPE